MTQHELPFDESGDEPTSRPDDASPPEPEPEDHPDEGDLQAWIDGELEPARAREVGVHLELCSSCRVVVEDLGDRARSTTRALAVLDRPAPEAGVDQARWNVRRRRLASRRPGASRRGVAAAAVLVLLAAGAAAALPGSPLRGFLWDDSGDREVRTLEPTATEAGLPRAGLALGYRDGRLEVELDGWPEGRTVELRSGEGAGVEVESWAQTGFRTGAGRVTVPGALLPEPPSEPTGGDPADLVIRIASGPGEVLVRSGSRLLVRWSGGSFQLGEGIQADPLSDGVRLQVPEARQ
ncbi:MAG: zf-HC2 domain-containing protein [Gemmatimonadales bacterium]|nr:MAG: zf-HC2 domain-containing protein [Gemmatimonadales bacterium]